MAAIGFGPMRLEDINEFGAVLGSPAFSLEDQD
jgi:hypothetical protein